MGKAASWENTVYVVLVSEKQYQVLFLIPHLTGEINL